MLRATIRHSAACKPKTTTTRTVPARVQIPKRNVHFMGLDLSATGVGTSITAVAGVGIVALAATRYKVSRPNQYLVRTGLGIDDIKISKTGVQWPFQNYEFIEVNPINYSFKIHAMSVEMLDFILPGVFTISPQDNTDAMAKYVRKLSNMSGGNSIEKIITGILEGETRTLAAKMTMLEIFNGREVFKETVITNVQKELQQFGLEINNANIQELEDGPNSRFFASLRQKKNSEVENKAKIDVAEAKKSGDIGQKERERTTRVEIVNFESEAVMKENDKQQAMEQSKTELEVKKSQLFKDREFARIDSVNAARMRETDLQRELEEKRIGMETVKRRAVELSKAQVDAETIAKEAEGKANAIRIDADAHLYKEQKAAEANLYTKQKEADGILAIYNAQSKGIQELINSFANNPDMLLKYLMVEKGLYVDLAKANAVAIKDMQPKITIWNTGGKSDGEGYTKSVSDLFKMLPPLLTTINDQTGITPPNWMMNLPKNQEEK